MYLKDLLKVGKVRNGRLTPSPLAFHTKTNCKKTRVFKMTKAEQTVYNALISKYPSALIAQQVRNLFQLEGGGMYIPDFLVVNAPSLPPLVVEVKGGYRGAGFEQGYERYKRAAAQFTKNGLFAFELWEVKGTTINVQCWDDE